MEGDDGPVPRQGRERPRARIRVAAVAASGGAAGGGQHVADVPGKQRLERLDGIGGGKPLEQMGQVRPVPTLIGGTPISD